jgi:TRAP-type C4-dicarboxylate transport system permease small subunit
MDELDSGPLDRLNGRITLWLARLAALMLAIIGVMTFADVFARYFLNKPFTGTVEFTEIMMGLMVFLGLGLATHERRHIGVDAVTMRLSKRTNALLDMVMSAIGLVVSCILFWQMYGKAMVLFQKGDYTPVYHVPYWPGLVAMSTGCVFLATGLAVHILRDIRALKADAEQKPAPDASAGM